MSKLDRQEVDNAVNQAAKEIGTRFDFRGVGASITWSGEHAVDIRANSEERAKAVLDVFKDKLVKRGVSLKALDYGKVEEASHGRARQTASLHVGINDEKAREIGKFIKGLGLKGVQHQVQADQLRVTGKKRDDLQAAIKSLREHDFGVPLEFTNFRD